MYVYFCDIIKVVDGDTLDVMIDLGFGMFAKKRVLLNLDAPEQFGPNASTEGKESSDFVKGWIESRQRLKDKGQGEFVYESETYDRFGRSLGNLVFLHKGHMADSLNDALLLAHYAAAIEPPKED